MAALDPEGHVGKKIGNDCKCLGIVHVLTLLLITEKLNARINRRLVKLAKW